MENSDVERGIRDVLVLKNYHPFSILLVPKLNGNSSFLKISFYLQDEVDEFKSLFDYDYLVDKTGFDIMDDGHTIIVHGLVLLDVLKKFEQWIEEL